MFVARLDKYLCAVLDWFFPFPHPIHSDELSCVPALPFCVPNVTYSCLSYTPAAQASFCDFVLKKKKKKKNFYVTCYCLVKSSFCCSSQFLPFGLGSYPFIRGLAFLFCHLCYSCCLVPK